VTVVGRRFWPTIDQSRGDCSPTIGGLAHGGRRLPAREEGIDRVRGNDGLAPHRVFAVLLEDGASSLQGSDFRATARSLRLGFRPVPVFGVKAQPGQNHDRGLTSNGEVSRPVPQKRNQSRPEEKAHQGEPPSTRAGRVVAVLSLVRGE
jgi:hypothetical protein